MAEKQVRTPLNLVWELEKSYKDIVKAIENSDEANYFIAKFSYKNALKNSEKLQYDMAIEIIPMYRSRFEELTKNIPWKEPA